MNAFKFLRHTYLCYFSKPAAHRTLYRLLCKRQIGSLVEVGLGRLDRTRRLLELAAEKTPVERLKYAGIDLFEGSPGSGLSLKSAHKELRPLCGKLQLVPGDIYSALSRSANSLTRTDLLIISHCHDSDLLTKAWFYVPRMLHDESLVLLEEPASKPGEMHFRQVPRLEIERLASASARRMRRAA